MSDTDISAQMLKEFDQMNDEKTEIEKHEPMRIRRYWKRCELEVRKGFFGDRTSDEYIADEINRHFSVNEADVDE